MFKYILKRLGLSLIVLLGVSVIIYFLVRLMPTNYVDDKFANELQQGTITHDQLDDTDFTCPRLTLILCGVLPASTRALNFLRI